MIELKEVSKWYGTVQVLNNCTTSIRTQHNAADRGKWDWRLLVNGKADGWLYETGAIGNGRLGFAELRERSLIDAEARAANDSPDFSRLIRARAPSFTDASR